MQQSRQKAANALQRRDVLLAGAAAIASVGAWTGESVAEQATQGTFLLLAAGRILLEIMSLGPPIKRSTAG